MANIVGEGVVNAKAAAHSAADVINENVDALKDKAAETLKAAEKAAENAKATAGKKLDEAKKKASGSVDDL